MLVGETLGAKLADFGSSRAAVDATMTNIGTQMWQAPEQMMEEHYTHKGASPPLRLLLPLHVPHSWSPPPSTARS